MQNTRRISVSRLWLLLTIVLSLFVTTCWCNKNRATNNNNDNDRKKHYKIAIVGAGVGGTSVAYFIRQLLENKLSPEFATYEVDIYEKSNHIGGRVATIQFGHNEYEAGGSIIHERNKYAADLVREFALNRKPDKDEKEQKLCIYNGHKNVFCENSWQPLTYIHLWFRYGFDPLRMQSRVSKVLDHFERIYTLQENEQAFEQVNEMLEAMNPSLLNLTKLSYKDLLLHEYDMSKSFTEELAQAITLVNYGQTVAIQSFVGLVSYAGAGAQLWSIEGGNKQLPLNLAHHSDARILLNTKVQSITYLGDHQFLLDSINLNQDEDELRHQSIVYDYVILATPLTVGNDIEFHNFTRRANLLNDIFVRYRMHQTVATFVKGVPLQDYKDRAVLSCNVGPEGAFFTSFSQLSTVNDTGSESVGEHKSESDVFKLFSNSQLKKPDLYTFFDHIEEIREIIWHAYPEYNRVGQPFPPFKIRSGMYYVNAIEWAASAIEMSLIGGKNVALLLCHDLHLCRHSDGDEIGNIEFVGNNKRTSSSQDVQTEKDINSNKRPKIEL